VSVIWMLALVYAVALAWWIAKGDKDDA